MKPDTIVVLDGWASNPGDLDWSPISRQAEKFACYEDTKPEETISRIGTAEVVFTNKVQITREVLAACPTLKYIGVLATGYNVVDLEACRERGVTVTNIPGYSTDSVAQFVFALLLELCHRVGHHHRELEQGRGRGLNCFCFWDTPQIELAGKTFGVVGWGAIGQKTAKIALAMGMKVKAFTPHPPAETGEITFVSLEQLLRESDIISLHCPLKEENRGMINRESLALCKEGAILINTARGGLVVEEDLRDALISGRLFGAAVDVVVNEPAVPETCPLLGLDNCIVTPHIAWGTLTARSRLMAIASENLRCWLAGEGKNVVS